MLVGIWQLDRISEIHLLIILSQWPRFMVFILLLYWLTITYTSFGLRLVVYHMYGYHSRDYNPLSSFVQS